MEMKEVNKLVTKAKRIWGQDKREIVYTDKIEREESAWFKDDEDLAMLVFRRDELDNQIVEYVDNVLAEHRREELEPEE